MLRVIFRRKHRAFGDVDPSRRNTIHAHVRPERDRQRMRQRDEAALAGGVGEGVWFRHMRAGGCDQYHAAFRGPQMRFPMLREQECRREIRGEDAVPVFERGFGERGTLHDPRVRHDGVDAAEARGGLRNEPAYIRLA